MLSLGFLLSFFAEFLLNYQFRMGGVPFLPRGLRNPKNQCYINSVSVQNCCHSFMFLELILFT